MKILIITGRFGMGHNSVARSLEQQIKSQMPEAQTDIVDLCDYIYPEKSERIYGIFRFFANRGSLFNAGYKTTAKIKLNVTALIPRSFVKGTKRLLQEYDPSAVICTIPVAPQLVAAVNKELENKYPQITCITDLRSHPYWINPGTDKYMVASEEIKRQLVGMGVPEDDVFVNGIPVKEEFTGIMPEREAAGEKRLLIMGGGLGLMSWPKAFYEGLNDLPGVRTTIITGNNKKLLKKLQGRYENIEVLGYTENIADYMRRSDLFISKAGGITVFESIYSELPILVLEPFLPQEVNNAQFVIQSDIGQMLGKKRAKKSVKTIEELIYDDSALRRLRNNMKGIKHTLDKAAVGRVLAAFTRGKQKGMAE